VLAQLAAAIGRTGSCRDSREVLLPLARDPPSSLPLALVLARLLAQPRSAARLASKAVAAYALGPEAVAELSRPR
jgi:hypothetical protein